MDSELDIDDVFAGIHLKKNDKITSICEGNTSYRWAGIQEDHALVDLLDIMLLPIQRI